MSTDQFNSHLFARFIVCRVRRGVEVESFQPSMDRELRESIRQQIADMKEDARRWGDSIVVRRIRRFHNI